MASNYHPKSVNIDKISTALHVYYLNLIIHEPNTVQIAQMQAYSTQVLLRIGFSTSKAATIFVSIETLSRLSIFRLMVEIKARYFAPQ